VSLQDFPALILTLSLLLMHSSNAAQSHADFVTFGSGGNTFTMEFVAIGDAGNSADTSGKPNPAGAVSYEYQIGKYEVSRDMIDQYNTNYGTSNSLEITLSDMTSYGGNGADRPATGISWNEAARFVNWLNTSQGYSAAYHFTSGGVNDNASVWSIGDAGYDASNPYRNSGAIYVLPSTDEFYKAAFYDPVAGTWLDYPTLDGNAPTAVASGTSVGTAVFDQTLETGPANVHQAGGLNAQGIMAMGGNVIEWEESSFDQTNSSGSLGRGRRGGYWGTPSSQVNYLSSALRSGNITTLESLTSGFRVVSLAAAVPEPSSLAVIGLLSLTGLCMRPRRKR
jgi:formylglycine-generating enzyme required for sulfatase activity